MCESATGTFIAVADNLNLCGPVLETGIAEDQQIAAPQFA